MTVNDWLYLGAFLAAAFLPAPFLGRYAAKALRGERHFLSFLGPVERAIYAAAGVDSERSMGWKEYVWSFLALNAVGLLVLMAILMLQDLLPFNPRKCAGMEAALAFNTAVSFVTNTNWQSYSGEAALSYFSQAAGLGVQNFLSAAVGLAVVLPLARVFAANDAKSLKWLFGRFSPVPARGDAKDGGSIHRPVMPGNFWVDVTRACLYVLLPLSLVFAVVLVSQGVPQTWAPYVEAATLDGGSQIVPRGPAASQVAIKMLGSNGGGFFGANSAHPLENPTPLSSFLQLVAIMLIPASVPFLFGELTGKRKQGLAIFGAMAILFVLGAVVSIPSEAAAGNAGFAMEGKEVRIGVVPSVLWSVVTTAVSNGGVNAMHASLSPISGMVAMINMLVGEVIFGGIGAGLAGMFAFAVVTVFVAGLMVGRGPELMGRKIEAREIQWAMVAIMAPAFVVLGGTALSLLVPAGREAALNGGPRGFSEILYAFASAAGNNGSAFAGLGAGNVFYCVALGIAMLLGRFGVLVPLLMIAASLSTKKVVPESAGTLRTDTALFAFLLAAVVIVVGGLTFFPALTLGPVAEHLIAGSGVFF